MSEVFQKKRVFTDTEDVPLSVCIGLKRLRNRAEMWRGTLSEHRPCSMGLRHKAGKTMVRKR